MPVAGRKASTWLRLLLALVWACWPAFLLYVLVLQAAGVSFGRLALSALLVPPLAYLAFRTTPKTHWFSRGEWIVLLATSGVFAALAGLGLSQLSEKAFLLSPQHELRVQTVQFADGQVLEIKWFHTGLGDVSLDSLRRGAGWKQTGDSLTLTSNSDALLVWRGWTGKDATLSLSGSRGVVIRVTWDGQPRTIDLGETRGRAVVAISFAPPWWSLAGIGGLLWGAVLYAAVMILLNSRIKSPAAYLPSWVGWTLLAGFALLLLILVLNVSMTDLQLLLGLSLALILAAPTYAAAGALAENAWVGRVKDWVLDRFQKHSRLLVVVCSLALVAGIFGRVLWANWALFDDHDIMLFVGPHRSLSLGELLRILPDIGSGTLGIATRFRPTYWFLRLLECVVWGARPFYWHAFRVVILVFAVTLFWMMVSPSLGWLGGGLLCVYALTFPYWREVIAYLGPGETYAVGGLPIYIWGLAQALKAPVNNQRTRPLAGAAVLAGSVVCTGSKENFILLVLPSLYLAYRGALRKDPVALLSAIGSIVFAGYVGIHVAMAMAGTGVDVYSHSVAISDRLAHALDGLQASQTVFPFLTLAGLAVALSAALLPHMFSKQVRMSILSAQFWLVVLCVVYLSQLYFYNGLWPTGTRYDFPGLLVIPAAILVLFRLGVNLSPDAHRAAVTRTARASLATTLLVLVVATGYRPTIQFINSYVTSTNQFVSGVGNIASTLQGHSDYALVVESGSVADYEAVFSYERFLRAYGVQNTFFLRLHGYSLDTAKYTQEATLIADLVQVSALGNNGYDPLSRVNQREINPYPGFAPLNQLGDFGMKCYSLILSGPASTTCRQIN